ncbi:DUF2946 family protein [Modicisalibacter radicis]|uniref:DUF2946 family protein n=1 Tax=Halomonas sp. EAR18 TaxID=2518972 RepID=UPI001443B5C9|nr:DUF2946 family protein [Halomonas sp. EAR18]
MSSLRASQAAPPRAIYLALLAMLLVLVGPIVGQLCAYGEPHHTAHGSRDGHAVGMASSAAEHHSPARDWHTQCGYCSLLLHVPVLDGVVPRIERQAQGVEDARVAAVRAAHGAPALFPHALTRAPPSAVL